MEAPAFDGPDLPIWTAETEEIDIFVRNCHTQKCRDFLSGYCKLHKPMRCFNFHFEGQRRRPPIGSDGQILYWDIPCECISHPAKCVWGDDCRLAHSKDEISYHPAKYKTRNCNRKDCRQAICCFAHEEGQLRKNATELYSQASLAAAVVKAQPMTDFAEMSAEEPAVPFDILSFKVHACKQGRTATHERKLCPFYHNSRDKRRHPEMYSAEACSECFDVEMPQPSRCSRGEDCPLAHNRLELLYHPEVFKKRFCATFPNVASCQRGTYCAFAHSREELQSKLFTHDEEARKGIDEYDFYMYRFKTLWCPYGVQHDWHQCVYAHTYQDFRRSPHLKYGSEPCAAWKKNLQLQNYEDRCLHGFRCQYAHGSKEQLYHPLYYKTMPCTDWTNNGNCPRQALCAFYHFPDEQRKVAAGKFDYSVSLPNNNALGALQPGFRKPPLFGMDAEDDTFTHQVDSLPGKETPAGFVLALTDPQLSTPQRRNRHRRGRQPRAASDTDAVGSAVAVATHLSSGLGGVGTSPGGWAAAENSFVAGSPPRRTSPDCHVDISDHGHWLSPATDASPYTPTTAGWVLGTGSSTHSFHPFDVCSEPSSSFSSPLMPWPGISPLQDACSAQSHRDVECSLFAAFPFDPGGRQTQDYHDGHRGPAYIRWGSGLQTSAHSVGHVDIVFRKPGCTP